jgi:hypothetical protein
MNTIRKCIAISLLFGSANINCFAAGIVTSEVDFVQVGATENRAVVQFVQPPSNSAACATDPRMAIVLDTQNGKAMYNMLLTAKASGKAVYASGSGSCHRNLEFISYLRLL